MGSSCTSSCKNNNNTSQSTFFAIEEESTSQKYQLKSNHQNQLIKGKPQFSLKEPVSKQYPEEEKFDIDDETGMPPPYKTNFILKPSEDMLSMCSNKSNQFHLLIKQQREELISQSNQMKKRSQIMTNSQVKKRQLNVNERRHKNPHTQIINQDICSDMNRENLVKQQLKGDLSERPKRNYHTLVPNSILKQKSRSYSNQKSIDNDSFGSRKKKVHFSGFYNKN